MPASKRLKNVAGVRGTHSKGMAGTPPVQTVMGNGPSGLRNEAGGQGTGTEASKTVADTTDLINFGMGDIRGKSRVLITLSSYGGTDEFKITVTFDHAAAVETAAFVRGTNGTAAAIQTALRTATGDALLLVTGATDEGPFTVRFSGAAKDASATHLSGNRRNIPTLSVTSGTGSTTGVISYPGYRRGLGETVYPVITGPGTNGEITTDAVGPAAGGIDVNYTIGAYTGVEVVVVANANTPNETIADVYETSSSPCRIEAADFHDGVGPGTGVAVDVYVRGYINTDPASDAAYDTFGPWSDKVDGTTA